MVAIEFGARSLVLDHAAWKERVSAATSVAEVHIRHEASCQHAACNMQRTCNLQHAAHNVQCGTYNMQHSCHVGGARLDSRRVDAVGFFAVAWLRYLSDHASPNRTWQWRMRAARECCMS
jgi:hypothetical protein